MRYFSGLSTVVSPRAAAVGRGAGSGEDFWYEPWGWVSSLQMAGGVAISPEQAMTLSYVQCAIQTISDDFGAMTCQLFKGDVDEERTRVKYSDPGIGGLAYRLRWQPNPFQSAKAFWSTLCWQYLLRPACYAEIMYRQGSGSIVDALVPRHPDRIEEQMLPAGVLRYKMREPNGQVRYVTQDEMFVIRNTSTDGLNAISRIGFGSKGIATGLALQEFTRNYFLTGATAALMATYKGAEMETEDEERLHKSISRYIAGTENAGGLLLVPEDIDVKSLGVDPKNAELLGLKEMSGRDVARMFKMPPHKLAIPGTANYASQTQSAQEYVTGTLQPIVVEFEQGIYIHLIVARDYFAKFNMDSLVRADLLTRMQAHEIAIRSRIYRPSTAQKMEDLPVDYALDRLSESDNRPGSSGSSQQQQTGQIKPQGSGAPVRALMAVHANAVICLQRERQHVERLAKKHSSDVEAWQGGLKDFYADHAAFVSKVMRIPIETARAYAAQHGHTFEVHGMKAIDGVAGEAWERVEADALCELALEPLAA